MFTKRINNNKYRYIHRYEQTILTIKLHSTLTRMSAVTHVYVAVYTSR